jgi:hypothetical protein
MISRISLSILLSVAFGCGGNGKAGEDVTEGTDLTSDTAEEMPVDPPDVPDEQAEDPGTQEEETGPADAPQDDAEEAEEEEDAAGPCGNGILEPALGEACDDGNAETEFCGRGDDCLGDCSLLEALCGNGILDPGEACDDAAVDSMGDCTTSCTVNDHGIGAPCRCDGCVTEQADFTSGTIVGCDDVVVPEGSGGVLACLYTFESPEVGFSVYAPEGYCTLLAMRCEGPETACYVVPQPGDLDTFSCPEGATEWTGTKTMFGATVTAKACSSDAQCRWNGWDEVMGACGQMACVASPANPSDAVCFDARNIGLLL